MKISQNDMERLVDMVQQGKMTVDEANVEKVLIQRVLLVTAKVPAQVRKSLNAAVKSGKLGHVKKEGHKPEAYFHPTFEYMAKAERASHERETLNALKSVFCVGSI